MLAQLSPTMRVQEAARLSMLCPLLAAAFARTKERYILHFPHGNRPFLVYSYRTDAEQDALYAQGRTTPGEIVTYKRKGQSKHNKKPAEAFDVGFVTDHNELDYSPRQYADFYSLLHEEFPSVVWGGKWRTFKDLPHFETPTNA